MQLTIWLKFAANWRLFWVLFFERSLTEPLPRFAPSCPKDGTGSESVSSASLRRFWAIWLMLTSENWLSKRRSCSYSCYGKFYRSCLEDFSCRLKFRLAVTVDCSGWDSGFLACKTPNSRAAEICPTDAFSCFELFNWELFRLHFRLRTEPLFEERFLTASESRFW